MKTQNDSGTARKNGLPATLSLARRTGLAARMRAELRAWARPRPGVALYGALGMEHGPARQGINQALRDFERRGEITRTPSGLIKYNHAWKRADPSPLKDKILRAMYVQGASFASTDIRRLVAEAEKSYVEKTIRRLLRNGYLLRVGRRLCGHGSGAEWLYNIPNRVRFRIDVMR
jgi:hypothetical protein